MKRTALVLAAALLGTGCIVVDDDDSCGRSVTVDWTLLDANGVTRACGYSGVQAIDVWVNGAWVATFDCVAGGGTAPLAAGTNDVVVEGVDGFGTIILRDHFSTNASSCGHQGTIAAQLAEGWVNLQYTLPGPAPSGECYSPGPSFIWVRAWDDLVGDVAVDSASDPEAFACPSAVKFRVAAGSYTLLDTHEVVRSGLSYAAVSRDCSDIPLTVGPGLTTDVPSDMVDAVGVGFCP